MIRVNEDGTVTCPQCNKTYLVELAQRADWAGKFSLMKTNTIQKVWPTAMEYQREQLTTGLCSDKCWNDFNKEEITAEDIYETDFPREPGG